MDELTKIVNMIVSMLYVAFGVVWYMVVHEIGYRRGVKDEKKRHEMDRDTRARYGQHD